MTSCWLRTDRSDIMAAALEGLAGAASQDAEACARLLGASRRIREDTGIHLTMIEGHDPQQAEDHARSVLGAQQYATPAETAKHRTLDEILTLATTTPAFKSAPSS
jgi:hypothetical protein